MRRPGPLSALLLLSACQRAEIALDGRPCRDGHCDSGWYCNAANTCVAGTPPAPCVPSCAGRCAGDDGCGGACPDVCVAPETCLVQGRTGVCGTWWSCDFTRRKRLGVVAAADAVPAGYSVPLTLDHAALVSAGLSQLDGNDVRLVFLDAGAWRELDRVLDPESAWNRADTTVWLALPQGLAAFGELPGLYLYYGALGAGAPAADEGRVFPFADFFDRADGTDLGPRWREVTDSTAGVPLDVGIKDRALFFGETGDVNRRPLVVADFAPLAADVELSFALDWTRLYGDRDYWVDVQLGDATTMITPADDSPITASAGVGPSVEWGVYPVCTTTLPPFCGPGNNLIAAVQPGVPDAYLSTIYRGRHVVDVRVDFAARRWDLAVDGVPSPHGPYVFLAASPVAEVQALSRLRIGTDSVTGDADEITGRSFDWVILRRRVGAEPRLGLGDVEASPCP